MTQVHIRQVPLVTSTNAQRIAGSWFPTSYYGNVRAQSRAELCNYFRQLAQPNPPRKFTARQAAEATAHVFSQHDNRFKFECDPLVRGTQSGFGKRRSQLNSRGEFDPLFISWVPKNTDRKTFVDQVKTTSYADDYNRESTPSHVLAEVQSINNNNENTSIPSSSSTSMYSSVYKHGQPDQERSKQIRRETFQRFFTRRTCLAQHQGNGRGATVASCLVWNNTTHDGNKSPIPNNIVIPTPVQAPVVADNHDNSTTSRQRAQSAGPRLLSTVSNQPPPQKPVQMQSMQMLKSPITTTERPHTATTTSREHYTGANFGPKISIPRPTAPYEQTYANQMQNLISKYISMAIRNIFRFHR